MKKHFFAFSFFLLLLVGCSSNNVEVQHPPQFSEAADPLEPINRVMWYFNYNILDEYILRPAAVAYADYLPQLVRTGLLNMALNLEEPTYTVNHLLQGRLSDSTVSLSRFLLNSTAGLFGTIDVAQMLGLQRKDESFGEVLGKWGVGTGPYLMLPAMGPNDFRSGFGEVVDNSYGPLDALNIYFTVFRAGIIALDTRASMRSQEQQLESSLDPYSFVKSAYFQNLDYKVKNKKTDDHEEEILYDDIVDQLNK